MGQRVVVWFLVGLATQVMLVRGQISQTQGDKTEIYLSVFFLKYRKKWPKKEHYSTSTCLVKKYQKRYIFYRIGGNKTLFTILVFFFFKFPVT